MTNLVKRIWTSWIPRPKPPVTTPTRSPVTFRHNNPARENTYLKRHCGLTESGSPRIGTLELETGDGCAGVAARRWTRISYGLETDGYHRLVATVASDDRRHGIEEANASS